MCNPLLIAQGATVVGDSAGAMFAASGQKAGLKAQTAISLINAREADEGARAVLRQGQRARQQQQMKTAQLKSSQRAAMAANGIDLSEGSAADVLASTDLMGEIDALTIDQNAVSEAASRRIQATGYRNEAMMAKATAKGINPLLTGVTSLISGATKVAATNYYASKGRT